MILRLGETVFLLFDAAMFGVVVLLAVQKLPGLVASNSPDRWVGMCYVLALPIIVLLVLWQFIRTGRSRFAALGLK